MAGLVECVPNVSEGRRAEVIRALADAVTDAGARLLDVHSDVDHHRSVFTFVGEGAVVVGAARALARVAVERIDLRGHAGVHPRIGAVDVVPFVPLAGSTMADAVRCAHEMGRAFAAESGVPVFFYGEATLRAERRQLPALRTGGFEGLAARMAQPGWRPDAGEAVPHPSAGATAVGARGPLIAFNAVLESGDLAVARAVATAIREASGGLAAVRALGVPLASRGLVQVSMNLLDYRRTPVHRVAERVEAEAERRGAPVREYELVGCAPADAFARRPGRPIRGLRPSQLLDAALFDRAAGG